MLLTDSGRDYFKRPDRGLHRFPRALLLLGDFSAEGGGNLREIDRRDIFILRKTLNHILQFGMF
jgi:hypothetical protein